MKLTVVSAAENDDDDDDDDGDNKQGREKIVMYICRHVWTNFRQIERIYKRIQRKQ